MTEANEPPEGTAREAVTGSHADAEESNSALARLLRKRWAYVLAGLMLASALVFESCMAFGDFDRLVAYGTCDDSFLYLTVARNWANTGRPTFDGETLTNGFQLLWALVLTALASYINDAHVLLRTAAFICALLNVGTGLLLYKLGVEIADRVVGLMAMALWSVYLFLPTSIIVMEAPLLGVVFTLAAFLSIRLWRRPVEEISSKQMLLLGAVLAAMGLCRLDAGIISAVIAGCFALRLLYARRIAPIAALAAAPVVVLSAYLLANHAAFGSATPVSGKAKVFWAYGARNPGLMGAAKTTVRGVVRVWLASILKVAVGRYAYWHPWFWAILVFALLVDGMATAKRKGKLSGLFLVLLAILFCHSVLINALLQQFGISHWYWQSLRLSLAVALGHSALLFSRGGRLERLKWPAVGVGTCVFVCSACMSTAKIREPMDRTADLYLSRLDAGAWISQTTEIEDDAAIASWNAGQIGYFSYPKPIVNLDGLVQSADYIDEVLRTGDWKGYFRKRGIAYLVDYNDADATMTADRKWDKDEEFRGLVPFDESRVIRKFGPILVLDIRPWLDEGT